MMIEKFAGARRLTGSEFLDLNHTSKTEHLVSFRSRSSLGTLVSSVGELRDQDTRELTRSTTPTGLTAAAYGLPRVRCRRADRAGGCDQHEALVATAVS